jgi:hypothetical protein
MHPIPRSRAYPMPVQWRVMMAIIVWRVALPAVLAGAVLGGGACMLASQGGAETAPRKAAPVNATKYDRVTDSGNVFYKVPAGYVAVKQKGGVIMVPRADIAAGELNGYLLLTDGLELDAGMKEKMKAAGKMTAVSALAVAVGGLAEDPDAKLSPPQLGNSDPAKDGYEAYNLVSISDDEAAGKKRFTQYTVFLIGNRAEIAMCVAYGSQQRLEPLLAGMDALTTSIEFRSAGAPPPARLAAALPTDLAAITPKPKPAPVQSASNGAARAKSSGGRNCTVRYRQQVYFKPYGGVSFLPVPYTPAGCP